MYEKHVIVQVFVFKMYSSVYFIYVIMYITT